ncbi:MAG: ATP synthase F0 subunit B [Patescibacteria group bacterium]
MESLAKLGIDLWGLVIYIINFGILWAVLAYFVFPKLIKAIDERRSQIENNLQTAEKLQSELEGVLTRSQQEKVELEAKLDSDRELLEADMAKAKAELLQEAELRKDALIQEARKLIREEKNRLIADTEGEMIAMMQRVLVKILSDKVDPADVKASVEQAWSEAREEVAS